MDFLLFHNLPAFSSAVVVRKKVFQSTGGFGADLVILSDWDMACRLARVGILRSVPDILVLYRQYPKNQSRDVGIHLESGTRSLTRFFSDPSLEPSIQAKSSKIWARFYAMLAGGYFRNREWGQAFLWAGKALKTSPQVIPYLFGLPVRLTRRFLVTARRPEISLHGLPFLETFRS